MTENGARTEFKENCEVCGEIVPSYDFILVADGEKYRRHCYRCYNRAFSEKLELDFEHPNFQPIILKDVDGAPHEFRFRTRIIGSGISIEALEIRDGEPGGYEFQIIGDLEADPLALFGQLFERIRKALSMQHITAGKYGLQISDPGVVRGRIGCDLERESEGRIPLTGH